MKHTQRTFKHIFNTEFNNLAYNIVGVGKCFHCSHFTVVPKETTKKNQNKLDNIAELQILVVCEILCTDAYCLL